MIRNLVVFGSVFFIAALNTKAGAGNPSIPCAGVDPLATYWLRTLAAVAATLTISVITIHHLPTIQAFVTSIVVTAGRSTRRLIALGLLLAFILALLYLTHELFDHIGILPAAITGLVSSGLMLLLATAARLVFAAPYAGLRIEATKGYYAETR